jgi:two-component sensor histidine kinase
MRSSRLLRAYNRAADHEPWQGYVFAAACVGCATAVRAVVGHYYPNATPFATFYAAILFAAVLAGPGPGALALVLSVVATWFFFIEPGGSFALAESVSTVNMILFASVGLLILLTGATLQAAFKGYRKALAAADAGEERKAELTRELEHRVRNILQTVAGLARQSARTAETLGDFSTTFEARLQALQATHRLLTDEQCSTLSLKDVLRAEIAPYDVSLDGTETFLLRGPDLELPAKLVTPFGLIIHELVTNAVKHGALVEGKGHVTVEWFAVTERHETRVVLNWYERGGPTVAAPTRTGFGSRLLNKLVQSDLQGALQCWYRPEGFEGELVFKVPTDLSKPDGSVIEQPRERAGDQGDLKSATSIAIADRPAPAALGGAGNQG